MTKNNKDYIVVKTHQEGMELSKSNIPSLSGKYIIVAPNGLEELSAEDLKDLPAIKQSQIEALQQVREKIAKDCKRVRKLKDASSDDLYALGCFMGLLNTRVLIDQQIKEIEKDFTK